MMTKKEALLEAAKDLFGEFGYAETTFKKISERAGVALGLLTHHYGNKEKLFLAAGLNVLEQFLDVLRAACADTKTGHAGVLSFCKAYLEFSVTPSSSWLVLVRCSPYSDMRVSADREIMYNKFNEVYEVLTKQLWLGLEDGSIRADVRMPEMTQVLIGLMVGVNRTKVLTPYADQYLYEEALLLVRAALAPCGRL